MALYPQKFATTTLPAAAGLNQGATGGTSSGALMHLDSSTGYSELRGLTDAVAWASLSSLPAPTGKGNLFDSTTFANHSSLAGTWTEVQRYYLNGTGAVPITADFYFRVYRYDTVLLTYTYVGTISTLAQAIAVAGTTVTSTGSLPQMDLGPNEMVYVDYWANLATNANPAGVVIGRHESTTLGQSTTNATITLPAVVVLGTSAVDCFTDAAATGGTIVTGSSTVDCFTNVASVTAIYNRHTAPPLVGPPLKLGYLNNYNGGFGVNGNRVRLQGALMYPYFTVGGTTYRGSAWQQATFTTYLDQVISWALQGKLTTLRVTDILEGSGVDPYNPTIKANLDYLLSKAKLRGLWVILDLSWYRNWLKANGHNDATCYDPANYTAYLKWLVPQYAKHTSVAYWSIGGEPAAPTGSDPTRTTTALLNSYYSTMYAQIRQLDPNHLIGSGGLSYLNFASGVDWQSIFTSVDMGAIHVYSHGDRDTTIPLVTPWCATHNKPFLIEEFGIQQTPAGAPNWPVPYVSQAAGYADIMSRCDNVLFWNMGPEVKPTTYDCDPTTQPNTWAQVVSHASTTRVTSRIRT